MRIRHLTKFIKDEAQKDTILEQIRTDIILLAHEIIGPLKSDKLPFDRIGVLDFNKKFLSDTGHYQWEYAKEWKFKE